MMIGDTFADPYGPRTKKGKFLGDILAVVRIEPDWTNDVIAVPVDRVEDYHNKVEGVVIYSFSSKVLQQKLGGNKT